MGEDKITLIIRVKESYNAACRCINSILRQSVGSYELCGIVYDENVAEELKNTYQDIDFCVVTDNEGCKNKFNSIVSRATTKYCMFVDSDSIFAVNAIERLLKYDSDLIVFNISRANSKEKFKVFYSDASFNSTANFMNNSQSVWAVAYKTEFLVRNKIKLKGFIYEKQALFILLCLSLAESIEFCKDVFLYKWTVSKKKIISEKFYQKNNNDIRRAIKGFVKKGDNQAKAQAVKIFLLDAIQESYGLPFIPKMKKMVSLVKLIWF